MLELPFPKQSPAALGDCFEMGRFSDPYRISNPPIHMCYVLRVLIFSGSQQAGHDSLETGMYVGSLSLGMTKRAPYGSSWHPKWEKKQDVITS